MEKIFYLGDNILMLFHVTISGENLSTSSQFCKVNIFHVIQTTFILQIGFKHYSILGKTMGKIIYMHGILKMFSCLNIAHNGKSNSGVLIFCL